MKNNSQWQHLALKKLLRDHFRTLLLCIIEISFPAVLHIKILDVLNFVILSD